MIDEIIEILRDCEKQKRKVFICGNGGSACSAIHFAEDLMGCGIRAMALLDIGFVTATANDLGYEYIFSRPLELWGDKGDVLITLSTSGLSENIVKVIDAAKKMEIKVISFPTNSYLHETTPRTEDFHLKMIHDIIIELS